MALTAIECATDAGNDDLRCEESGHNSEYHPVLVVDGVDTHDVHERAASEENGRADRFEEVEVLAHLRCDVSIS